MVEIDGNTTTVILAAIGAIVTLGTAYIAARYAITRRNTANNSKNTGVTGENEIGKKP